MPEGIEDRLRDLGYEAVDADGRKEVMRLSGQRSILTTIGDEVLVGSS